MSGMYSSTARLFLQWSTSSGSSSETWRNRSTSTLSGSKSFLYLKTFEAICLSYTTLLLSPLLLSPLSAVTLNFFILCSRCSTCNCQLVISGNLNIYLEEPSTSHSPFQQFNSIDCVTALIQQCVQLLAQLMNIRHVNRRRNNSHLILLE